MRIIELALLVVGIVILPAATAAAVSMNIEPVADAFVAQSNPDNNYGGGGAVETSAAGLPKGEFKSLLKFDFSGAKTSFDTTLGAGQWIVQSVSLKLTAANPSNNAQFNASAAGNFGITWMQDDSWVEGAGTPMAPDNVGITYNTLPSFLSGADQNAGGFSFNGATSGNFNYSISLVSGLVGDVNGGQLASLLLAATDTTLSALFNSRTNMVAANHPVLTVNAVAVPEPASWILVALAGLALFWIRRTRA